MLPSTLISILVYTSIGATPLIAVVSLCMAVVMTFNNWQRKQGRLILVTLWGVVGITLIGGFFWLDQNVRAMHEKHRNELTAFAKTVAAALEIAGHADVATKMSIDDPLVVRLEYKVLFWLRSLPDVASIYTLRKREAGDWIFVISPATDLNRNGIYGEVQANESHIPPFTQISADKTLWLPCLRGESVFSFDRIHDQWGSWITAAEPLYNDRGEVEAVCALDFWSDQLDVDLMLARVSPQAMMVLVLTIFFTTTTFLLQGWRKVADMQRYSDLLKTHLQDEMSNCETKSSSNDYDFFLAKIIHEVCRHITSIIGYTDILESKTTSLTKQDRAASDILHSTEQILATLNAILDVSKDEADKNSKAAVEPPVPPPKTSLAGLRILLAEDSTDSRRLFETILTKVGANVVAVADGLAAFETTVNGWRAGRPFDLLLIDVQMPVMSGLAVVRCLRGIEYGGTILALTASTSPEEVHKCHDAGCNGHAAKPIRREELIEAVLRHAPPSSPTPSPTVS